MRLALAAAVLTAVVAQESQQPPPRFRTGVDVVLLDVTVLDRDRRPVRGLQARDFVILEDGQPQPIVSFEELDAPEPDGSLVPWMREVAPDVRTNSADHRRLVLIVLDDATISFEFRDQVKRIGTLLIDRLGPTDQAAVVFTGRNARSQDFTDDRRTLRAAIDRYVDTSMPAELRSKYALGTLRRAAETLIAIPHRRKTIIYVGSMRVASVGQGGEAGLGLLGGEAEKAALNRDLDYDMRELIKHAQRSNVNVYTINPAGLETLDKNSLGTPGPDFTAETLMSIANATGGFAVVNTNSFGAQIGQIFRETGSYYLLGFKSQHNDGRFRRLQIKVNRPNVIVRSRNGYEAPRPDKQQRASRADEMPLPLARAVSGILPTPDMPMRVSVAPFATPGRNTATVAIVLGLRQPPPADRVVEKIDVLSRAFDIDGRARAMFRQVVQLTLRPAEGATEAKYEVFSRLDLPPGRYQLRFAVHSGSLQKSGSVYHDLEIPDFSRGPTLSGIVVGVEPALPVAPKDFFATALPVAPTTQRSFAPRDRATAFLRSYHGRKRPLSAIVLTTTIVNEQDREVHAAREMIEPAQVDAAGAVDHRFELPLDRLPTGAYLLRFTLGEGEKSTTRHVRFVVR